jgi:hypothetical protein
MRRLSTPVLQWIVLSVLLLAGFLPPAASQPSGGSLPAPAPSNNATWDFSKRPLKVCTTQFKPLTVCTPNGPSASATGYDVEVFRIVAQSLGLQEQVDYTFACIDSYDEITESLKPEDGSCPECDICPMASNCRPDCDLGVAAITVTTDLIKQGVVFSYPYLRSSLGIIVKVETMRSTGWSWIDPLSGELWGAVGLTLIIFPCIIFLIEFFAIRRRMKASHVAEGFNDGIYRGVNSFIHGDAFEVRSCLPFFSFVVVGRNPL